MAKYDDASWHLEGEYPADLPEENAAIHIGILLSWFAENNMLSNFQIEEAGEDANRLKNLEISGAEFLMTHCDGKFTDEDLNDIGNKFAADYYEAETDFAKKYKSYLSDYSDLFEQHFTSKGAHPESMYHISDIGEIYQIMKPRINQRFLEWKAFRN